MTASESIKMLEIQKPAYGCKEYQKPLMYAYDMAIKALEEVQQYRAIGTPEELQVAMEKQIAKKPIIKHGKYCNAYHCPVCNGYIRSINTRIEVILDENISCGVGGQKLDWSDEDETDRSSRP